jgi:hypothetical protein
VDNQNKSKQQTSSGSGREGFISSYTSGSAGSHYKIELLPNQAAFGMLPGANQGYARIQVDPSTGTLKARTAAHNRGGPSYLIKDDGDRWDYTVFQTWGTGTSLGGIRRYFEVTGTAPVTFTLSETFQGELEAEELTSAGFRTISSVTLVKDEDAFFELMGEMSWGMATDMAGDPDSYDWLFGEDQEVAEFLLQTGFTDGIENAEKAERTISGAHHPTFTANPGDLILVEDWLSVYAVCMNPCEIINGENRALADYFTLTSELNIEGETGGLQAHTYFDGADIGTPLPAIGTHSDYCWMSVVTCTVDSVEGYANAGWTGTGSVPATGASTTTGAITLSDPNSSIAWEWAFGGYELTVENGSGSGTYTNGALLPIVADAGDFYCWSGELAGELDDLYSAATTLRMPAENVLLTPIYHLSEVYVDAAMTDDSQDGHSWATAKRTIQAAADLVALNGTVWVTNGVYNWGEIAIDDSNVNRVQITRPVTVRSVNGAEETVIVGETEWGGVRAVSMTNGCTLIGFTIQDSSVAGEGGGVLLTDGCTVEDCLIVGNAAGTYGGGTYMQGGGTLNNCIVRSNTAAVCGGGIGMSGGSVNNCLIVGNDGTMPSIGAAGVYMTGGELVNSTVVSNADHGGVSGAGDVLNCIVWGNSVSNLLMTSGSVLNTCADSGVEQDVDGCMTADPQFVDAAAGDFQLSASSPCIDAGDNAVAPVGRDLANRTRVVNGTVDLGAYERFLVEADTDLDTLPDWWESRYFGTPTAAPQYDALSSNGINTVREAYIIGLDPNDPGSEFVTRVTRISGARPIVQWDRVPGRVYSVYWSSDLGTSFSLLRSNLRWNASGFEDTEHDAAEKGFYKIDVRLDE